MPTGPGVETARAPVTLGRRVAGAAMTLQLLLTGLFGHCLVILPLGLLMRFGPGWALKLGRRGVDAVIGLWLNWNAAWMELVCGVRFVRTGDAAGAAEPAGRAESSIIMCNHRTRLDWQWMYPWCAAWSRAHNYKAVLKAGLAALPGVGWAMQLGGLVFLRRRWEEDRGTMDAQLGYYAGARYPLWLVFFPEGTDRSAKNLELSRQHAEKKGLPVWHEVLHPRTTGLVHTVRTLGDGLDSVYDVTVAYTGFVTETEKQMAAGLFPDAVHIHARRYSAAELRELDDEALAQWVRDRFAEKEKWLADFYARRAAEPAPPRRPLAELARDYGAGVAAWLALLAAAFAYLHATWPYVLAACVFSHLYTKHGEPWALVESRRATATGVQFRPDGRGRAARGKRE